MNKYEQLIEHIINDEADKARELFHNIVVEKSRDIYESLIDESDLDEDLGGNPVQGLAQDVQMDEEGIAEEEEGEEEFGAEEDGDEFGGEEHEEAEIEDRVLDLESALDELKAEFDALMADEAHEPEHHDGVDDPDFGGEEEFGGEEGAPEEFYEAEEEDDDDEEDEEDLEETIVREYVEKVGDTGQRSEGGEVGKAGSANINKGSIVAGKNDMGGTSANIVKGGSEANPNGTSAKKPNNYGTKGQGELIGKVQNTPGANAGKTAFKTKESSTGAEGKLAGADGSRPVNKQSPIRKA